MESFHAILKKENVKEHLVILKTEVFSIGIANHAIECLVDLEKGSLMHVAYKPFLELKGEFVLVLLYPQFHFLD